MEETSPADLELLLREIQVLEEENFVLNDAQVAVEASLSSPKGHNEQGDLNAPGHKVCMYSSADLNVLVGSNVEPPCLLGASL
jgi:hypothetical protein